jgi:hypothetical protein
MQLSTELHLEILQYVLGWNIYPHVLYTPIPGTNKVVLGSSHRNVPYIRRNDTHAASRYNPPNYTILRFNKTISAEAFLAGWQGTPKALH